MKHLVVDQVTTVLGKKELIKNVSLEVNRGEVFALVGHNGAGKSTLMKTIMKMLDKRSGKIMIQEQYDQDEHLLLFKQHISYLPEEPLLLTELTVLQHFQMYAMSYELSKEMFEKEISEISERIRFKFETASLSGRIVERNAPKSANDLRIVAGSTCIIN